MKRFPREVIPVLVIGFGLGLFYAWMISPIRYINTVPNTLRADFKDQYRMLIAASYASTHDLARAKSRIQLLGDNDPVQALTAQAQRMLSEGQPSDIIQQVAMLAADLQSGTAQIPPKAAPTVSVETPNSTASASTSGTETPQATTNESPTTEIINTIIPLTITPRPTYTPTPTSGAPFILLSIDKHVCKPNLTDGLMQISVIDSRGHQMPGVEIIITWDGGEENFFTGLKSELPAGYADYIMQANVTYTVRIAESGTPVPNLTAPSCTDSSGQTYMGGLHLTFQQP